MADELYDTIIIGAGISGLTAAMYASRKRMKYKILSTDFGGQFMVSGEVLNYPGIIETTGVDFASVLEKQMEFNDVKVDIETVGEIKKDGENFVVVSQNGQYKTQSVIIATGSRPKKLNVPGEKEFAKKGVTYCSICDGPLFSGMEVAILGGGASALEAVDFLTDIASKIHLIVNGDKLGGHEYLQENIAGNAKVEVHYNTETKEIKGDGFVSSLKISENGVEKELGVRGVIVEIGRIANTDPFKGFVELDEHGHILVDCQGHTSVPGIFASGDCASGHEYQYVISAGQGCMALIKAARYLAIKKK